MEPPSQVHPGRSGTRVKFLQMGFSGVPLSCVPPGAPGVPEGQNSGNQQERRVWTSVRSEKVQSNFMDDDHLSVLG